MVDEKSGSPKAEAGDFALKKLDHELRQNLLPYQARRWVLAFSGGLDSQVLLHALTRLRLADQILAIHVNHQIHPDADQWQIHCQKQCDLLGLEIKIERINLPKCNKESLEQAARRLRYQAIAKHLDKNSILITAHHLDDQAETFLLRLLRGTGVRGLGAIAPARQVEGTTRVRPLLKVSRQEIKAYAEQNSLVWIEDPSNDDQTIRRNYLRKEIFPAISKYWPSASKTLEACAEHMRESQELLDELAKIDWQAIKHAQHNRVLLVKLEKLSARRQKNCLRWWLDNLQALAPPALALQEFLKQIETSVNQDALSLRWGKNEFRVFQGAIVFRAEGFNYTAYSEKEFNFSEYCQVNELLSLSCKATHGLGIRVPKPSEKVKILFRQGGESCRLSKNKPRKTLKDLFQHFEIPAWLRSGWPLIYYDDKLVGAAGLWVAEEFLPREADASYFIEAKLNF